MKNVIFTIVSNNYYARALTLMDSLRKVDDTSELYIVLADEQREEVAYNSSTYTMVYLDSIKFPNLDEMKFKYNITEFNTAIKPFVFQYFFNLGYEKIIYLDPDIYVYNSLEPIYSELDKYSIVLTPHRVCPNLKDDVSALSEVEISATGIFNLGFCAFANNAVGRKAIAWWCDKLKNYCFVDYKMGLFYDQKWMNYMPCFFSHETKILLEPGMNFAPWNFDEREIYTQDGNYYVRDSEGRSSKLFFIHFSGFNPMKKPYLVQQHIVEIALPQQWEKFSEEYANRLLKNGFIEYKDIPYAFSVYQNGDRITALHRQIFRELIEQNIIYENPFATQKGSFYELIKRSKLICNKQEINRKRDVENFDKKAGKINSLLRLVKGVLGVEKYTLLMRYMQNASQLKNQCFLLKRKKSEGRKNV